LANRLGIHYQIIAITLGLILFAGSISGSASIAFADDDDKKEKLKKLKELLKKLRDRHNDRDRDNDDHDRDRDNDDHDRDRDDDDDDRDRDDDDDDRDDDDDDDRCPVKHKYEELCDKKKPKIKITSPNKNEEVEGPTVMITGTASDDLSGIKQVLVRIDKGSYEEADFDKNTGTWKFTTGPLDPGKHKVTAKAEDKANNFKRDSVKFKVVASSDENGINIRIDSRSDDAEQKNKRVKTTSKDLDLNEEDLVGLRFNDVDIPKGSTITSAFVGVFIVILIIIILLDYVAPRRKPVVDVLTVSVPKQTIFSKPSSDSDSNQKEDNFHPTSLDAATNLEVNQAMKTLSNLREMKMLDNPVR